MTGDEVTRRLGSARSEVERACTWLANPSPAVLERCTDVLSVAASDFTDCAGWLSLVRGDPDALAETRELQKAVRRAGKLLDYASQYHIRWTRTLSSLVDGYRPGGAAAPLSVPSKISLEG